MRFICTVILLWVCITANAQSDPAEEITKAKSLIDKGDKWMQKHKDSAFYYFKSAYRIHEKHHNWLDCITALFYINYTSGLYFDLVEYQKSLHMADALLKEHRAYFDSINEYKWVKSYILTDKANYYSKIRDYKKAREYTVKLREFVEAFPDSIKTAEDIEDVERAYRYEGKSYEQEGKYAIAQALYEKSLRLALERSEGAARSVYRLLGSLYKKQQQHERSNHYLKKGIQGETGKNAISKNRIVTSCYVMASNYAALRKTDSALYYLRVAEQQLTENDALTYRYYQRLGEVYKTAERYEEGLTALDTALSLIANAGLKRVERATLYSAKARIYDAMGNYEATANHYQEAFKALAKDFSPQNSAENPVLDNASHKTEYLKLLNGKAAALHKTRDFDAASKTAVMAVRVLDSLKPEFHNEEDKQLLIENSYSVFESGLAALMEDDTKTEDADRVDQAFFMIEKSKSAVLLEALLSAKAYDFAGIPETLLEKELQLKANMNHFRKEADKNTADAAWKDRLFEVKNEYRALIREFESNYPEYYDLKYNSRVADVGTLQRTLDANTLLLSYFYGKEALYAVAVSSTTKELLKIPLNNDLETLIRELYTMLTNPESDPEMLTTISQRLYYYIVFPLLQDKPHNRLIVMPDGILNYIPFEILYNGNQYITERMAVSYAPSATLLQQLQQKKPGNTRVMAFAPDFSVLQEGKNEIGSVLHPLPNAEKEALDVLSYFKGRLYENAEATLKNFNTESVAYGIYHLATHAVVNDETPGYSYLAFTPKENEEYLLYLNDIYAMKINAAMVALSACESGIGDLKKGEGMMSLSRAFFYAGAASIANTRWDISDYSAAQLMKHFYRYLSEGKTKDEALQLAKAAFVKENKSNRLSHPYYWAGLVITGNTAAVKTSLPLWKWLLPLSVVVMVMMFWVLRKRKKAV